MAPLDEIKQLLGKFYLTENGEDRQINPILEIEEKEYYEIKNLNSQLYQFRYFQRKILEIKLNHDDYFFIVERYQKQLFEKKNEQERYRILDLAYVDINRVFINFISSFKSFLEHFEMRLKSKYGKESEQVINFKKFNSSNYDNMLAHRLLVNLRNYAQHDDFPIFDLDYDIDYKNNKWELVPMFNKAKLANSIINKKIENDLKVMNHTFPVQPQMINILKYINILIDKVIELEFHTLKNAAITILNYFSKNNKTPATKIGFVELTKGGFVWNLTILEVETSQFLIEKIGIK